MRTTIILLVALGLPFGLATPAFATGTTATVTRVIDGDTFEISTGEKVRVLGIDSCEMSTVGGREAKDMAETFLGTTSVILKSEPTGPDKDKYGRLLRYVTAPSGLDFGTLMVQSAHTGIYRNGDQRYNDASPAYIAELRQYDTDGRNCAGMYNQPPPATNYGGGNDYHHDGNDKSRFCRRHWYCSW